MKFRKILTLKWIDLEALGQLMASICLSCANLFQLQCSQIIPVPPSSTKHTCEHSEQPAMAKKCQNATGNGDLMVSSDNSNGIKYLLVVKSLVRLWKQQNFSVKCWGFIWWTNLLNESFYFTDLSNSIYQKHHITAEFTLLSPPKAVQHRE